MNQAVGGKVLHIPGISTATDEVKGFNPKWHQTVRFNIAIQIMATISMVPLYFLTIDLRNRLSVDFGPREGYYQLFQRHDEIIAYIIVIVYYFLAILISHAKWQVFTIQTQNKGVIVPPEHSRRMNFSTGFFVAASTIFFVLLSNAPNPSPDPQSFSDWAKEKYQLSEFQPLNGKDILYGKNMAGENVRLFVSNDNGQVRIFDSLEELENSTK